MRKAETPSIESSITADYQEWSEAVSQDLQQIAVLHDREVDGELIDALREVNFPHNLGFTITSNLSNDNDKLLQPQKIVEVALQELPDVMDAQALDRLAVDYADIYLNHSLHASPFESVWLDEDNLVQQEPMFKVRDWYKRYGVSSANWRIRSEDHLVLQLQFIAMLLDSDTSFAKTISLKKRLEDATNFMDEHLLLWLPEFSNLVSQRCSTDFYASVAVLTYAYIDQLRDALAEITGIEKPSEEQLVQMKLKATQAVVEEPISFMPGVAESW